MRKTSVMKNSISNEMSVYLFSPFPPLLATFI